MNLRFLICPMLILALLLNKRQNYYQSFLCNAPVFWRFWNSAVQSFWFQLLVLTPTEPREFHVEALVNSLAIKDMSAARVKRGVALEQLSHKLRSTSSCNPIVLILCIYLVLVQPTIYSQTSRFWLALVFFPLFRSRICVHTLALSCIDSEETAFSSFSLVRWTSIASINLHLT